jgi:hypothetical protein
MQAVVTPSIGGSGGGGAMFMRKTVSVPNFSQVQYQFKKSWGASFA